LTGIRIAVTKTSLRERLFRKLPNERQSRLQTFGFRSASHTLGNPSLYDGQMDVYVSREGRKMAGNWRVFLCAAVLAGAGFACLRGVLKGSWRFRIPQRRPRPIR
jgi:hypothetical protein